MLSEDGPYPADGPCNLYCRRSHVIYTADGPRNQLVTDWVSEPGPHSSTLSERAPPTEFTHSSIDQLFPSVKELDMDVLTPGHTETDGLPSPS